MQYNKNKIHNTLFSMALTGLLAHSATAQQIEEIVVQGNPIGELGLNRESDAGSRLGLSLLETPATVEIIDSDVMRARGYQKLSDAVQSLPGVVSGESPAAPSMFSMRGFTRSQITILRDGLWVGPANMVMRPQNTFNLERVEVLRGPSSVLNGQGAVAGTVNTVNKTAGPGEQQSLDVMASYGRFNTYQAGIGVSGALTDSLWYRADLSQFGADGFVDRMDPESGNFTGSLYWQATDKLAVKVSADYLNDDLADYYGTPLLPATAAIAPMTDVITTTGGETVDAAMRFRNYNVADSRAESQQLFLRGDLIWNPVDNLEIRNTLYSFDADRQWQNAEGYVYCTEVVDVCTQTDVIQRYYGYFFVGHDQQLGGNRLTAKYDYEFAGMSNQVLAGFEVTSLEFSRDRGFRLNVPLQPGDSVDPYNPVPGSYGPRELRGISPTDIKTRALFMEDALVLNERISLIGALRYEELDLDRRNFNGAGVLEASSFARDFDWWSWRLGGVYSFNDNLVAYAQYSDAKDPVNANIFLVSGGENLNLTDAEQWEIGLKGVFADGRTQATLAYFDITRDDVLERIGVDSATNVGGRSARGLEFSSTLSATEQLRLGINAAWTDAQFDTSTNLVTFAGNTPPNVPRVTANLWSSYSVANLPLDIGGSLRYVDDRFGDNANTVTLHAYTVADLYAAWSFANYRVTGRIFNVADEQYAPWSDIFYMQQTDPGFLYANQVLLGAPRAWELGVEATF
ncbi:MAG: TonB-dependent receptor [Pseudohongiellaceae bacterium]|jgi:iron complex outermembrane receptor protein